MLTIDDFVCLSQTLSEHPVVLPNFGILFQTKPVKVFVRLRYTRHKSLCCKNAVTQWYVMLISSWHFNCQNYFPIFQRWWMHDDDRCRNVKQTFVLQFWSFLNDLEKCKICQRYGPWMSERDKRVCSGTCRSVLLRHEPARRAGTPCRGRIAEMLLRYRISQPSVAHEVTTKHPTYAK